MIICAACEILASEHGPLQIAIQVGAKGLAGYLVPVMLLLCGTLLWFNVAERAFNSLLAMVLALFSWITSNLGGFFIGMLLGLVGGALALAWTTGSERQPLRWPHSNLQIRPSPWGVALTFRPMKALPPSAPAERTSAGGGVGSAGQPPDSAVKTAPDEPAMQVKGITSAESLSGTPSSTVAEPLEVMPPTTQLGDLGRPDCAAGSADEVGSAGDSLLGELGLYDAKVQPGDPHRTT